MGTKRSSLFTSVYILSLCKQILILLSTLWMVDSQCPTKCTCGETNDMTAVNCEDRGLLRIPMDIANNTQLLRFRNNKVTELPLNMSKLFPKLQKIDLEQNAIRRIPPEGFAGLSELYSITLTANQLTEVGGRIFRDVGKELVVSMTHNNLTSLPDDLLAGFNHAISLYLEDNKISSLSSKVFGGFTKLKVLSLKKNHLTEIPGTALNDIHDLFNLDLASNRLNVLHKDTFKGLPSLETLLLQKNRLTSLHRDTFKGLIRLKTIDLRSNQFKIPPFEALEQLHDGVKVKMLNNPIICDCNLANIIKNQTLKWKIFDIEEITCLQSKELLLSALRKLSCIPETTTVASTSTASPATQGRPGPRNIEPTTPAPSNHLPLLISIILGVFIILTITTVFVYLYRRPIMGRIVRVRTLSYHKRAVAKDKIHSKDHFEASPQSMRDLPDSAFA